MSEPLAPLAEVKAAYKLINAVLQPLTRGEGREAIAARRAYGALQLLRQWARQGARDG